MITLGIRELRDGLSKNLALVKEGESITVTEHGRPIARIVPAEHNDVLERLIAEGRVTRALLPKGVLEMPPGPVVRVVEQLLEDRR